MNWRWAAYREALALWVAGWFLVCSGCFLPRNPAALEKAARPDRLVAILPVQPRDIRITVEGDTASEREIVIRGFTKDQLAVAHDANAVFNSLAGGRTNSLLGPDKTAARLGPAGIEELMVYLNDPGGLDQSWKRAGLARLAAKLPGQSCVRVHVLLVYEHEHRPHYPQTLEWAAKVTVQLSEIDLAQGRVIAQSKGESRFSGSIGAIGGPQAAVPYAIGTTLGRALDQAARPAFAELFHAVRKEPSPE